MDDLGTGLRIAVAGMAIVFGLLVLLWALLTLGLRLESRGAGSRTPPPSIVPPHDAVEPDPHLVAAIAVAVGRHAELRRRQAAPAMRSYWPGSLLFASRWVSAGRTRQAQSWRRR
jgi:Na+-transporting methylmalonyl-CoA/oxaloacetate decarboxylase gamma subunit